MVVPKMAGARRGFGGRGRGRGGRVGGKKGRTKKNTDNEVYYGRQHPLVKSNWLVPFKIFKQHLPPLVNGRMVSASIDPGYVNLAIRVEEITPDGIFPRLYKKFPLSREMPCRLYEMRRHLDEHKDLFMELHYVFVEKQMNFNGQADRIGHDIISYFTGILRNSTIFPRVLEVDSKLKTTILSKEKVPSDQTKEWSKVLCRKELIERGDIESLEKYDKEKKKDDLADVVTMAKAMYEVLGVSPQNILTWKEYEFSGV